MNWYNTPDRQLDDDYKEQDKCALCGEYDELDQHDLCCGCAYDQRFEYDPTDDW